MSETELQIAVADYLRLQYPNVLFHSDYGSGVKLTPRQAVIQKRQNGGRRAWPDIGIMQAKCYWGSSADGRSATLKHNHGLFLELKKDGTRLKKKNGEWATEHIAEQAKILEGLRQRGYCAEFAVGFEEAKSIIDGYLG